MMELDMRYLLVRTHTVDQPVGEGRPLGSIIAFLSFMLTYEDGFKVIYCYEVHVLEGWRGKKIGKGLMEILESIGRAVGVEKSMLTVFTTNEHAQDLYRYLGYDVDDYSPQPKRLRGGKIKQPDYLIMSKTLR